MGKKSKKVCNCKYCGRFYKPDKRVKGQKSCYRKECKSKRKKESQKAWSAKNPDYFKGRYKETKAWREENPDYQSQWRKKQGEIQDSIPISSPVKTVRLVIPVKMLKSEIQDSIQVFSQCGCGFLLTRVIPRDTRLDGKKISPLGEYSK